MKHEMKSYAIEIQGIKDGKKDTVLFSKVEALTSREASYKAENRAEELGYKNPITKSIHRNK